MSTDDPPPSGTTPEEHLLLPQLPLPRIAPLELDEADEFQAELLGPLGGQDALHLFRTLAHHPKLLKSWLPFGGRLLYGGALSGRDRELVILRVSFLCGSDYEWGQHVAIARNAGVSDEEIVRLAAHDVDQTWSEREATLLSATDELVAHHMIDRNTWASLSHNYDDAQLIELTMLAGHYALLAGTLNSIGVTTESPLPKLGTV